MKLVRALNVAFAALLLCSAALAEEPTEAPPADSGPQQVERDPMVPVQMNLFLQEPTASKIERDTGSGFKIQGLGRSKRGAYIVIDGHVYREGEEYQGVKVVKIGDKNVDILVDGFEESIPLKKEPVERS